MQLGFVTAILPDFSLEDVLSTARDLGYDCIEVMCWPPGKADRRYAGVTHIDVVELDQAAAQRTSELFAAHDISISALGYYPNVLSPDRDEARLGVEQIQRVIAACKTLGVKTMTSFVGRDWTQSLDANWPRFLETWTPLIKFAEDHDVRVGIENCPMWFTNDEWPSGKNLATAPAIWERMFNDIPSDYFGLNYDPSHLVWQQMDYLRPLRDYADKMFHVHAKDVRLDRDRLDYVGMLANPSEYHTPKLPGLGDVDWGQFCSILGDYGYDGPVCVEVEDRVFEGSAAARVRSLKQSCTYLRNFIN